MLLKHYVVFNAVFYNVSRNWDVTKMGMLLYGSFVKKSEGQNGQKQHLDDIETRYDCNILYSI